jgi:hypothetical protein
MLEQSTIEIFGIALWTAFVIYTTWYFTSAKHYAPITSAEAKILWKIHRRNSGCEGRKWRELKRGGKIVGFECECGQKHIQRRPIVVRAPIPRTTFETYGDSDVYLLGISSETKRSA